MRTVAASGRPLEFAAVAVLLVRRSFSRGYFEQALESARTAWADAQRLEGGDISGVLEEMVISALTANGRLQEALLMMHSALDGARETGRAAVLFRYRRLRAAVLAEPGQPGRCRSRGQGRHRPAGAAWLPAPGRPALGGHSRVGSTPGELGRSVFDVSHVMAFSR